MHCYVCGAQVDPKRYLRRRVKTGDSSRRAQEWPHRPRLQLHFGMRVVCAFCAQRIDAMERRREQLNWLSLAVSVAVLLSCLALLIS